MLLTHIFPFFIHSCPMCFTLQYLQFDTQRKVSLTELSYALEQELHSMEEDNAAYQAALATYEHEAKYLR